MTAAHSQFHLWSWEHMAWWRANGSGYTTTLREAGLYSHEAAAAIVVGHIPPGEEVAVLAQYAQLYGRPPAYQPRGAEVRHD